METINYTPGQILYIKSEYGEAYVSIINGTAPHNEGTMIHTCCDLTIHEYSGNMYEGDMTFARENGTMLDVDANFEEIRHAEEFEKKMLFNALVRGFKDHDLGWANHFTDSTYDDIRDWLCWEFNIDLDNTDNDNRLVDIIFEIINYIWDSLCKETGNYQACIDYVEPEMVNKQEFIEKVVEWVKNRDNVEKYLHVRTSLVDGFADALRKYLEE